MLDTMTILRDAVYTALAGNITNSSTPVNVYDEKKPAGVTDDIFIILSTQQESEAPQETSETFSTLSTIDIEIWHKTGYEVSKATIDAISNQVLTIIVPTTYSTGMAQPSGFQILNVKRDRAISRNVSLTDSQSVVGKIITISCIIVQQNI